MNETQNALFDFAFKRALRDLDELFDLAQGQGEFDAVWQARHVLLSARPGRKTETAAPLLRPGDTIPFTLVNNPGGPAVEVKADRTPSGARPKQDSPLFSLPEIIQCGWCLETVAPGTEHKPTGPCEPCEGLGWVPKTAKEIAAEVKAYQPELFDNKEDSDGKEVGPPPVGPSHVEVLHTGMDFTGDWVTAGGHLAIVIGPLPLDGGWIGVEQLQLRTKTVTLLPLTLNWDVKGTCTNAGAEWNLVERIREGKYSR